MLDIYPKDIGAAPPLLSAVECRAHCKVDGADEDVELLGYAAAAQAWVENFTGLRLTPRPARAVTEGWANWRIVGGPPPAIDGIRYSDADGQVQTLPPEDYIVTEQLGLAVVRLRPMSPPAALQPDFVIRIDMTIGFAAGAVPPDLRVACLLLLGHYHRNREAVVAGAAPAELPLAVESLCIRHRIMVLP